MKSRNANIKWNWEGLLKSGSGEFREAKAKILRAPDQEVRKGQDWGRVILSGL